MTDSQTSTATVQRAMRRSFTAPSRSSGIPREEAEDVKTLFQHPFTKIIVFSPSLDSSTRSTSGLSKKGTAAEAQVGTLPWGSHTERTASVGPLSVFQRSGSCSFIKSGQVLRPVLNRSQAWCVDNETKFVLALGENRYYRIELPNDSAEDKERAEEFKSVLSKILRYERTACPFKRSFYIELPDLPDTPKKPWTPKHRPITQAENQFESQDLEGDSEPTPDFDVDSATTTDNEATVTKPNRLERTPSSDAPLFRNQAADNPKQPIVSPLLELFEAKNVRFDSQITSPRLSEEELDYLSMDDFGIPSRAVNAQQQNVEESGLKGWNDPRSRESMEEVNAYEPETDNMKTPTRPKALSGSRSVTAPPQLSMAISPPSTSQGPLGLLRRDSETPSIASSIESFHSFHSFHSPTSPLPPSPPLSRPASPHQSSRVDLGIDVQRARSHRRDLSELTVTAESFGIETDANMPAWPPMDDDDDSMYESMTAMTPIRPLTPALSSENASQTSLQAPDPLTPSASTAIRRRMGKRRRRSHSPLPAPANLYYPGTGLSGHHLTRAIVQKTCSLFLGPSLQLVALMVNIARKIADGVFKGEAHGYDEGGRLIPCSWDFSDEVSATGHATSAVEEDDYGNRLTARSRSAKESGGSWEIE